MTQVIILWAGSATVILFGEFQLFPHFTGFYLSLFHHKICHILRTTLWNSNSNIFQQNEEQSCLCAMVQVRHIYIFQIDPNKKLPRGFYSSVFGYRFCLRASITFNAGEFKIETVTCHLLPQHHDFRLNSLSELFIMTQARSIWGCSYIWWKERMTIVYLGESQLQLSSIVLFLT